MTLPHDPEPVNPGPDDFDIRSAPLTVALAVGVYGFCRACVWLHGVML